MKTGKSQFRFSWSTLPVIISTVALIITITTLPFLLFPETDVPVEAYQQELSELEKGDLTFEELKDYFKNLTAQKGAEYAYAVLLKAPIPPQTDLHLLAHAIGDVLYKQKGADGMKVCTEDFRNACSHSIVINLFYEKGEPGLEQIISACNQAPGGSRAYNMCYHGLGHGVFAYTGYNLAKTVELCKKTGTEKYHNREYAECVGGAVMEQISGGSHDESTWAKMRTFNLLGDKNPLYPCMSDTISDQEPRNLCLIYMTPYFWELAGRDGFIPSDATMTKSFEYCTLIPASEAQSKDACFGGFGKEFVVLVNEADVRGVEKMTDDQFKQVHHWCTLTSDPDGRDSCIRYVTGSLFWNGTVDRHISMRFCDLSPDNSTKENCYKGIIGNVMQYTSDKTERENFCREVPESLKDHCEKTLLLSTDEKT